MSRRFGVSSIVLGAALILHISPATAQTRSGGNWGGRTGNSQQRGDVNAYQGSQAQGSSGYGYQRGNSYQPQQQYSPNFDSQQRGYSNGYQGRQSEGSFAYGYQRGNSYAAPEYGPYEPRYERRGWRERMWRERMWRERNRRHGWDW